MPAISASAPGKLILCGEHAVVYNQPAIAIPVLSLSTTTKIFAHPTAPKGEVIINAASQRIKENIHVLPEDHSIRRIVELVQANFGLSEMPACEIQITSTLPIASGLGSSASLSISVIRALSEFIGHPLPVERVNALAFEAEEIHHGNPSGIDNTVIAYEKPVYFERGKPLQFISIGTSMHIIIASTGISTSTALAVAGVHDRWQKDPARYEALFTQIGSLSRQIRQYLSQGFTKPVGELLTRNHSLLQEMGVSCPELDQLVNVSLAAGALGAKLSGGGMGGNMLALVKEETSPTIEKALTSAGAKFCLKVTLPSSMEG